MALSTLEVGKPLENAYALSEPPEDPKYQVSVNVDFVLVIVALEEPANTPDSARYKVGVGAAVGKVQEARFVGV